MSQKLKIALGDLRHETIGRHSIFMPISIAYIASYLLTRIDNDRVEIRLYDRPGEILKDIERWRPDVVGLSNYCWNAELSRVVFDYSKQVNPSTVCIAGGPEFPVEQQECRQYLLDRKEIDFYVYLEGESVFAELIEKLIKGVMSAELKSAAHEGIMSIHPRTGELVVGSPAARIVNLDEIPSPYLTGLLDRWFDGCYAPSIETTRGCPFSCGYCCAGRTWYDAITKFSTERIKAELTYIASRMAAYPNILLSICDANFGMYARDEEIAGHIGSLQDKFGWPNSFDVTTGKANYDRILRIVSVLKNKMQITCSVQSLNPKTLQVIKRKNLPMDEYKRIQSEIKRRGMRSVAELIVPMPEETKFSFLNGVRDVVGAEVEFVVPYTTMLLKGTYLGLRECRKKYAMQTKFRLIPRQFGEYAGRKCFEVEEVCVGTNTMSFDDYLDCRGFGLISAILSSEQFDIIRRHLKELDVDYCDYLYYMWELIQSQRSGLSVVYKQYIEETQNELWDNREALCEYLAQQQVYENLLRGEVGDNLIRKYKARAFLDCSVQTFDLAYTAIEKLAGDKITDKIRESLNSAKQWATAIRDIGALRRELSINACELMQLPYDVNKWYGGGDDGKGLVYYNHPSTYKIFYDSEEIKKFLNEAAQLYGENLEHRIGMLLVNWNVGKLWRKCEPVTKEVAQC